MYGFHWTVHVTYSAFFSLFFLLFAILNVYAVVHTYIFVSVLQMRCIRIMRPPLAISMSAQSDPFLGISNDNNNETTIVHMMFARAQRFYLGFHLNIWAQQFQPKLPSNHIKSENRMEKKAFGYAIPDCSLFFSRLPFVPTESSKRTRYTDFDVYSNIIYSCVLWLFFLLCIYIYIYRM